MLDWCSSARMCVRAPKAVEGEDSTQALAYPKAHTDDDGESISKVPEWCTKIVTRAKASKLFGGNPVDLGREKKIAARTPGGKRKKAASTSVRDEELQFDLPNLDRDYTLINGGGLGKLRMAIHIESKQRRAILTLGKRNVPADIKKEDIEKQLELLLKIDHLNILAFHEACVDKKNIHLVYEWPEGGLLLDHLTRNHDKISEREFSEIFREVMSAIAAANHFNVHHLDWSLICLFIGRRNHFKNQFSPSPIKLFGIGLAGFLFPLANTRKNSLANKHYYIAPELITENHRSMSHMKQHACDVWSIGTLLYMLFSGRPPFYGQRNEVEDQIKKGTWIFGYEFDMISKEAKNLIEKTMERNIKMRKPASELLKHPWLQPQHKHKSHHSLKGALDELQQFATETHCKQTLARLMADLGLQESEYSDLEERFKELDLDGNGVIEMEELAKVAAELPGVDAEAVESIMTSCDRNGNMTVDISEFISAVVLSLEQKDERLLIKAFEKMDMNNDARITKGELFRILSQYSGTLEPGEISSFVDSVDNDHDKKIDYNEFKHLFHTGEKDRELQRRIGDLKREKIEKPQALRHIATDLHKLMYDLRFITGKLAKLYTEYNEEEIAGRLKEFLTCLRDFAGKTMPQDGFIAPVVGEKETKMQKDLNSNITGLAVFSFHKRADADAKDRERNQASGDESDHQQNAKTATSSAAPGAVAPPSPTQQQKQQQQVAQHGHHEKTVGEIYVGRALMHKRGPNGHKWMKKEISKRRRYLWMGGGDALKHAESAFKYAEIVLGPSKQPDNKRSTLVRRPSDRGTTNDSGRLSGSERKSMAKDGAFSDRLSGRSSGIAESEAASESSTSSEDDNDEGKEGEGDEEKSDSEDGAGFAGDLEAFIVPWTKDKAKMRRTKEAMKLAAIGAALDKINNNSAEYQRVHTENIRNTLFMEHRMSQEITEDQPLTDLKKLTTWKCLRSWIPIVMLWEKELQLSKDEMKVNVYERRSTHKNCILHMMQLSERIMFSLNELLLWQHEGFTAMFALEEAATAPPPSRRFLPFRVGELDENARTPRNEEDAENLAPDAAVDRSRFEDSELQNATEASVACSEGQEDTNGSAVDRTDRSHGSEANSGRGADYDSHQRRLDRTVVRSRHEKKSEADKKKMHDLAEAAQLKASQSFYGSIAN